MKWIVACILICCLAAISDTTAASEFGAQVKIKVAKDLGVISPPEPVMGRDGGYSVRFANHSIWIFGDTLFKSKNQPTTEFQSNSWSWTKDLDASDGIALFSQTTESNGHPSLLVPFTDAEKTFNAVHAESNCIAAPCDTRWALWPGAIVADPIHNRMLLFYEKLYIQPGELNYKVAGYSVTAWYNYAKQPQRMKFYQGRDYPTLMFGHDEPGFGDAAVVSGRKLYIYGCRQDGVNMPCRIARVELDRVFDKTYWETWTVDDAWGSDLTKSKPIFNGNEILSVAYNPFLDCFISVYSQPMSTSVMLRTSVNPEGPWSAPVELFKARPAVSKFGWIYDALEHPEYQQKDGQLLYITYSRQISASEFELRLVAIEIEKTGRSNEEY